jgi:DNA polymerase-1
MKAQAERMAINAPIQGTQADIIKLAMTEADRLIEREGWRSHVRLLMQIHDELIYEVATDRVSHVAPVLRDAMERVAPIDMLRGVPIKAEVAVGKDWGDMKRID